MLGEEQSLNSFAVNESFGSVGMFSKERSRSMEEAQRMDAKAKEMRALAQTCDNDRSRRTYEDIASTYERLANGYRSVQQYKTPSS